MSENAPDQQSAVHLEVHGNVLVMRIDRPEARNAVNAAVANGIEAGIDRLEEDDSLWVGILTDTREFFSAGADLKAVSTGGGGALGTERGGFAGIVARQRTKPIIAAVNGVAAGGGLILALIGLHLLLVVLHKHTQYPGPGRTQHNVVGYPFLPIYIGKQAGFLFMIFGFLALMGGTMTINPVWNYGPYDPSPVTAGAQPDWYMLFLEGGLRLMPGWEFVIAGFTVSLNILIPGVVIPGLLFTTFAIWPFLEAAVTKDKGEHHLLDRPRNAPTRTAVGVSLITAFMVLNLAGANDLIATHFELSLNGITWFLRIAFFLGPWFAFWITKRICLALQRRDRELALHGHETGRIVRLETGQYLEVHQPLDDDERGGGHERQEEVTDDGGVAPSSARHHRFPAMAALRDKPHAYGSKSPVLAWH